MKRNHSIQLMGASGSAWLQILGHGRLAPTADARRWTATRDLELLLQDLHHEQSAVRRATAEAIAAHPEMWSDARRKMRECLEDPDASVRQLADRILNENSQGPTVPKQ